MLRSATAELLVRFAEDALDRQVAFDVGAGLVTGGMEPHAWSKLGVRVARLVERGDDPVLVVGLLHAIPHQRVHEHLSDLTSRGDDPLALEAARVLYDGTPERADALQPHVAALVSRLRDAADSSAYMSLAFLDVGRFGVDPASFAPGLAARDASTRLWAAIGAAKSGDHGALGDALDGLDADPPAFMWGDPWSAYGQLQRAAPVRDDLHAWLVARYDDSLGREQRLVIGALTGRWDAEGQPLDETPEPATPPSGSQEHGNLDDGDLDTVAEVLSVGSLGADTLTVTGAQLASLEPDQAGRLLSGLVERTMAAHVSERLHWGNLTMRIAARLDHADLPVHSLVTAYLNAPDTMPRVQLGAVLARGDGDAVATALVDVAGTAAPEAQSELAALWRDSAVCARNGLTPVLGAGPSMAEPPLAMAEPPLAMAEPPADIPHERPLPAPMPPNDETASTLPEVAHPLLEAPQAVVAREPFEVTIGLSEFFAPGASTTGELSPRDLAEGADTLTLEVELVVDPSSLTLHDSSAHPLSTHVVMTAQDPYPTVAITLSAQTAPDLLPRRTVRALFRLRGSVVAIATRQVTVVGHSSQVATAALAAPVAERPLLSLTPLLGEEPPDLIVGIYASDETADTYLWEAYPLRSSARLPDNDARRTTLDATARTLADNFRLLVSLRDTDPVALYDQVLGYGDAVASAMPASLVQVLETLVTGSSTATTVLFLTEESLVPWELARLRLDPGVVSPGGASPFLGAQVVFGRWPVTQQGAPPGPVAAMTVPRRAAVTADYRRISERDALDAAVAETARFSATYAPVEQVAANREALREVLQGTTPYDLVHMALHGQFDATTQQDGLVLIREGPSGPVKDFLSALAIRGLDRNAVSTPFVFLNACEVGAGADVLGNYGGVAAALLSTGASGVVAPLWKIKDTVAAEVADRFYALTLSATPVGVGEALRQIRAGYTRDAVQQRPEEVTATYLAYQFYGHPGLTLHRTDRTPT